MIGKSVVFVFGLPFLGVGLWMLWSASGMFLQAWQMNSWANTEAYLTRGGYETHDSGNSPTYQAFATYNYSFDGQQYQGNRVTLNSGSDNIGSYQQDIGNDLRNAASSGKSIQVFVDPESPSSSIIDPEVRWSIIGFRLIFIVMFGGVGLALVTAPWRAPKAKDTTLPEYQNAPWLLNDSWQTATIRSDSKQQMRRACGFAAFAVLVSAPLPFLVYQEVTEKHNQLALIGLLFPVIGIGLLVRAIRRTLEWRAFGPVPVSLDPYPGSIGGHVGGTTELAIPFDASNEFSLTLTNFHSYTTGTGKNRRRQEKAIWQKNLRVPATMGTKGTRLTFRFDVPEYCKESDAIKEDSYHGWRLNLSATLVGTNLNRDYELPVYATAKQSRLLSQNAISRSEDLQATADEKAVRDAVNLESSHDGKRMYFPVGRNVHAAMIAVLVGSIFAAAGWFISFEMGEKIFGAIFGSLGGLVILGGLYLMLNSLEVKQVGREIRTVRRLLGIPIGRNSMQLDAFKSFRKSSALQTQSDTKNVMYYSVEAIDRQDNKLTLGVGFKGENEADAAIKLIVEEFSLVQDSNDTQNADDEYLTID